MRSLERRLTALEATSPSKYDHLTDDELNARFVEVLNRLVEELGRREANGEALPEGWREILIGNDVEAISQLLRDIRCETSNDA